MARIRQSRPDSSECGTHKTVKAKLWPWISGEILYIVPTSLGSGLAIRNGFGGGLCARLCYFDPFIFFFLSLNFFICFTSYL